MNLLAWTFLHIVVSRCLQVAIILSLTYTLAFAQNLTDAQILVVNQRLADGASHSWEYGARSEVLLEYYAPSYSVLSSSAVPPPQQIPSNLTSALSPVLTIAHTIVANRSVSSGGITGPQPLIPDSAVGDPASIGMAVILANWTGQNAQDGLDYAGAAQDQLDFLFQKAPKTSDGAISHRMEQVQLWSDFIYMVPPFLAYYGVVTENRTLLEEAHNQIKLYRNYLRDTKAHNLWKHIQLGSSGTDNGHWSTGNAWAASGMIRVLGTIQRSQYADSLKSQQADLANWVQEIHGGMYRNIDSSGLFHNYADDTSTFLDASSTALLASTVYRLSLLWGVHTYLPMAERSRKSLSSPSDTTSTVSADVSILTAPPTSTTTSPTASPTTGSLEMLHLTSEGWLMPVANPYAYPLQGQFSPEGQAFVLSMQSAWRDWVADGAKGANSAPRSMELNMPVLAAALLGVFVTWSCV